MQAQIKRDIQRIAKLLNFVVIRNYEFLFDNSLEIENDLDILINNLTSAQTQVIEKEGYWQSHDSKYRTTFAKFFPKQNKIFFLDFHKRNLTGNQISYKIENQIIRNKKIKNGVPIPRNEDYLTTLLFRELFAEGFKTKYRDRLISLLKICNLKEIAHQLSNNLNIKDAKKVLVLLKRHDFDALEKLRRTIKYKFVVSNIFDYTKAFLSLKKPKPKIIAVIGIDGSGKTTIVENCCRILNNSGISAKKFYMGRGGNNALPVSKPASLVKGKVDLMSSKIIKKLVYSSAAFVYTVDFYIRHRRLLQSKENILISDRFSSDILLMDNVPKSLRIFLYKLLPKANQYIYLQNNLSVLKRRRSEHSFKDLKRQEKEFDWIKKIIKPLEIKNEDIDETSEQILRLVVS